MLYRVFRKFYDFVCQRILDSNKNFSKQGFMEINPQYFDEMIVQTNMVDYWIGQLESHIAQTRVKEQMYKEGIARCNYIVQEVLPLVGTAMALLRQSVDYNSKIEKQLDAIDNGNMTEKTTSTVRSSDSSALSGDEKLHFQNITLMMGDTFERLGEKRKKINQWVAQAQIVHNVMPEA